MGSSTEARLLDENGCSFDSDICLATIEPLEDLDDFKDFVKDMEE